MLEVTLDLTGLDAVAGEIESVLSSALKVGILPEHNARDDGDTNAVVGLKNEFGWGPSETSPEQESVRGRSHMEWGRIPQRSFLRVPLIEHLGRKINESESVIKEAVEGRLSVGLPEIIGSVATQTIQDAFDTAGFGKWQANDPDTAKWKGSDRPLIDTNQLRDSIAFEVVSA